MLGTISFEKGQLSIHTTNQGKLSKAHQTKYLWAGLAVVATNPRTTAGLVGPENAAFLVSPDSPQEMAEAMIRLLVDERLRRSMQKGPFGLSEYSNMSFIFTLSP